MRTKIVEPAVDRSARKGSDVVLPCGVVNDVDVVVTWRWFRDDRLFDGSTVQQQLRPDGGLELHDVDANDTGIYKCSVSSLGGNDTSTSKLKVTGQFFKVKRHELIVQGRSELGGKKTVSYRKIDLSSKPGDGGVGLFIKRFVSYMQFIGLYYNVISMIRQLQF